MLKNRTRYPGIIIKHLPLLILAFVLLLIFVLTGQGCSKGKKKVNLTDYELYTFGEKDMSKERYEKAQESFKRIIEEYPDSELRKDALLRLGDSYYNNENYEEARIEYLKYLEIFPATTMAARAQYYLAMTWFLQIRSPERDQNASRQALKEFERVLQKYPASEYAKRAVEKVKICNAWLARSEFNIGMFYYKKKAYQSAIWRFENLLKKGENYPFSDKILFYIASSYYESQNYDQAGAFYRQMLTLYPGSPLASEAQRRLNSIR